MNNLVPDHGPAVAQETFCNCKAKVLTQSDGMLTGWYKFAPNTKGENLISHLYHVAITVTNANHNGVRDQLLMCQ